MKMVLTLLLMVFCFMSPPEEARGIDKDGLVDAIARETGLSREDSKKALDAFVKTVSASLKSGSPVAIDGFGDFLVDTNQPDWALSFRSGQDLQKLLPRRPPPPPSGVQALSGGGQEFEMAGGAGRFTVTAQGTHNWRATANADWIVISGTGRGLGNGVVNFSLKPNPGQDPRTGLITVGEKTFQVVQQGRRPAPKSNPPRPR